VLEPAIHRDLSPRPSAPTVPINELWGSYSVAFEPATEESVKGGRTACTIKNRYPPELNEETWPIIVQRLAKDVVLICATSTASSSPRCVSRTIERVMERLGVPAQRAHTI